MTSGFDRHRIIDTDESDDSEGNQNSKSPANNNGELLEMKKLYEKEKKAREEAEKKSSFEKDKNSKLTLEMKECIKTFYPTSWKDRGEYAHTRIDAWDYQKIRTISTVSFAS